MIRNLSSSMDGPEVIMDAEEYLQPKSRCPLPSSSMATGETTLPPPTPVKKYPNGSSSSSNGTQHHGSEFVMGASALGSVYGAEGGFSHAGNGGTSSALSTLSGGHLHYAHHQQPPPSGNSLRYCSDPLQLIGKGTSLHEAVSISGLMT